MNEDMMSNWQTAWSIAQEAKKAGDIELVDEACAAILAVNPNFWFAHALPKHARGYYAQIGQDAIIEKFFLAHPVKNKIFVDVGACDGVHYSNVRRLHEQYGWTGICIEPVQKNYEKLQNSYRGTSVKCVRAAVSDVEGEMEINVGTYPHLPDWASDMATFCANEMERWKQYELEWNKEIVPVQRLTTILDQQGIHGIDLLSIDTEGNDLKVIQSFDLLRFQPTLIVVEYGKNRKEIILYLSKFGYSLLLDNEQDLFMSRIEHYFIKTNFKLPQTKNYTGLTGIPPYEEIQEEIENKLHEFIEKTVSAVQGIVIVGGYLGFEIDRILKNYPNAEIHVFEASLRYFHLLSKRFAGNSRVFCYNYAVSDENGTALFHETTIEGTGSLLPIKTHKDDQTWIAPNAYPSERYSVSTVTLDSFTPLAGRPIDLLWVDVQGAEMKILKGAKQTLQRCRALFLEVCMYKTMYEGQCKMSDLEAHLQEHDFYLAGIGLCHSGNSTGNTMWLRANSVSSALAASVTSSRQDHRVDTSAGAAQPNPKTESAPSPRLYYVPNGDDYHIAELLRQLFPEVKPFGCRDVEDYIDRRVLAYKTPNASAIMFEEVRRMQPDLVYLESGYNIDPWVLERIRTELGIPVTMWFGDACVNQQFIERILQYANVVSWQVVVDRQVFDEAQQRGITNVEFLANFGYDHYFHPLSVGKTIDIFFSGKSYLRDLQTYPFARQRLAFIQQVNQVFGAQLMVCGEDWESLRLANYHNKRVPEWDINKLNNAAKIVLAFDAAQMQKFTSIRTFNALLGKSFVLIRAFPGIDKFFVNGEHLVWFKSPEEGIELIKHYLAHPNERDRIAQNGYELVHSNGWKFSNVAKYLVARGMGAETRRFEEIHAPYSHHHAPAIQRSEPVQPLKTALHLSTPQQKITVSAIVSTYNSENFIRGCLQDLIEQTLFQKEQLEIVVVDTASPQNEQAIVEEFQRKYGSDKIVYIRTSRRETLYAAWNRGIQVARGHYITNANTDDRHRKDALEILSHILDEYPDVDLVYGDCHVSTVANESYDDNDKRCIFRYPEYFAPVALVHFQFGPQPMWRKSVHDKIGYFDESFQAAGDYDFNIRFALKGLRALHVPDAVGLYLLHNKAISTANNDVMQHENARIAQTYKTIENVEKLYKAAGIPCNTPEDRAKALIDMGIRLQEFYPPWYEGRVDSNIPFALECFSKAAELCPLMPASVNNRAALLFVQGLRNEAVKLMQEFLVYAQNEVVRRNLELVTGQGTPGTQLQFLPSGLSLPTQRDLTFENKGFDRQNVLRQRSLDREQQEIVSGVESSADDVTDFELSRQMRILLACDYFWPSVGGTELFVEELGVRLLDEGFNVEVACAWMPQRIESERRSLKVHQFRCNGNTSYGFNREIERFREFVVGSGFDAVIVLGHPHVWTVASLTNLPEPRPRLIVMPSINADDISAWRQQNITHHIEAILAQADEIITVSESGCDAQFVAQAGLQSHFIPHAVEDTASAQNFREEFGFRRDVPLLVMVANFWPVKNHLGLLETLRHAEGAWQLALIGNVNADRSLTQYYEHVVEQAKYDTRIRVIGGLPPDKAAAAIRDADLLLVPSKGESAGPLVVLQAMHYSTPWIATPECNAVGDEAGGVVVPLTEFPRVIERLLNDRSLRAELGKLGKEHWQCCFQWEQSLSAFVNVLIGKKPLPDLRMPCDLRSRNQVVQQQALIQSVSALREFPLVSIITPCTRLHFLPRALKSIFDQTYQNFEILIVNDGGEDFKDVIDSFNDGRIRYYRHEEQRGPSAARNTALRHATGKYVAYLDDDDFYYPSHLQILVEFLETSDYKVAYTDGYCSWESFEDGEWKTYKKMLLYSNEFEIDQLLLDNLFQTNAFMHYRICPFETGFFDEDIAGHDDWEFWIRMALKYPFHHIPKVTYEYTTRAGSDNLRLRWSGEVLRTFLVIHERYKDYAKPYMQREQEELRQRFVGLSINGISDATREQLVRMKPEQAVRRIVEASYVLNNSRDMESAHNIALLLVNRLQDNADLWLSLAKSLRFLGQQQSALNAVSRSLELQETPEGLSELIHTLKALGRTEDEGKSRQDFQLKFPQYAVLPEYPSAQKPLNIEPPPFEEFQDNHLKPNVPPFIPQQRIKRIQSDYENVWRVWRRDESLQWIAAELERMPGQYQCISFDFFDTLVARFCPEPVDLFVEVGRRLADLGLLKMPVSDEEYRNLRVAAENKARNLAFLTDSKVEISIAQIYAHLQYVVTEPERSAAIELQVEKERCYLNPCTTQLLQYARSRGLRIVVLSDTYYSADALCSILEFNGFNVNEIDLLLTSCDVGATKANGELFRVAVSRLGIQPSEMLHVGDNWEADYRDASQVGVKAFYYYRTTPYIHEVLQRERRIAGAWPALSSGIDSLRVLAQRLDGHIGRDKAYYRDGAFLLGPVMARFADWCVEQFREAGITRVLGLMREGEFLGKMLERAASDRGLHLEVVPFYTSRKATHLASVGEGTSLNLNLRMMQRTHRTVRKILELFGIRHGDIGEVLTQAELEVPLDSPEVFSKLEKIIGSSSAAARSLLMAYLGPLVEEHSQIGILDLGWHCTIQDNLVNILRHAGCPIRILGCYLATNQDACKRALNGTEVRAYLGNMGSRDVLTEDLMRSPFFIEQTISACVGSTEGYRVNGNGEVEPVLGPLRASEKECERKRLVQQGILAFQEIWLSVVNAKPTKTLGTSCITLRMLEEIDRYNLALIHRLVAFPTGQEARRFGTFHHDDNFGSDSWQLICNDDSRQALRVSGVIGLYQNPSTYWPQGVMAMERPEVVRQLSVGWRDPAQLSRSGAWPRYKGEFLPYSHNEKDVLDELLCKHKPGVVVIFGQGNSAVRRWLLDTLSALPASGAHVKRAVIEAVRHPVSSSNGAVPYIYHQLLAGNFVSEGFLAKVEQEVRKLPQAERVFLYLDHTCAGEEVERVLNILASRLQLGDLVVVGHGGNDTFELGEPQSAYMSTQRWFEESGRNHGFLRVQNPIWPAELFTIFLKDSVVVSNATLPHLRLQDINLIVFPDWSGSEEALGWELAQIIKALATHPDKSHMTLLIDSSNIAEEDADMMLSGLTMTLLMQEDLKLDEGPEISLIGQLREIQWEALLPRLHARIVLENENQHAIMRARAENIQLYELDCGTLPPLRLKDINLIVFPDWSRPEEALGLELQQVIKALATDPDKNNMTLLIDTSNIAEEDAELMLSSVIMNLLMQENLEINEGPEISLVGQLSKIQWEALLPRLHARIVLENENQQAIAQAKFENIPFCQLDSIRISELCC